MTTDSTDPRDWTVHHLARAAECSDPDTLTSPGARFLTGVRDAVIEEWEYLGGTGVDVDAFRDDLADTLDPCVPVYTSDLWSAFVDLGAYNEDPTDLGADASNMAQAAAVCLYVIGERLAHAVIDALTAEPEPTYLLVLDTTEDPGVVYVADGDDGQVVDALGRIDYRTDDAGAPTDESYAAAVAAARAAGWATAGTRWDVTPDGYALAVDRA